MIQIISSENNRINRVTKFYFKVSIEILLKDFQFRHCLLAISCEIIRMVYGVLLKPNFIDSG